MLTVAYRKMTANDFYVINRRPEDGSGGKQSYIDFPVAAISGRQWERFFEGTGAVRGSTRSGPYWVFTVRNLGTGTRQRNVKLGQRRAASYSIRSQKLPQHSSKGQRLHAWTPTRTGFPAMPANVESADDVPPSLVRNLRVFLIRDGAGTIWAGWTRKRPDPGMAPALQDMLGSDAGMIAVSGYEVDDSDPDWPFRRTQSRGR